METQIKKIYRDNYPYLLREARGAPESMEIIGEMPSDDHTFLCVIGSRDHSDYGREACAQLIRGLAGWPIVIVSGLAIGIDSIAHEAALGAGLKTVAFPGSGLGDDVLYPQHHKGLAKRIVGAGGALVSKFPADAHMQKWMFLVRNNLMATISQATLVIEGGPGSGTLGTAKYAEDHDRDVLAVPGRIDSNLSYGPNMLIKRGAAPIVSSFDILEALGFTGTSRYDDPGKREKIAREQSEQLVLDLDAIHLTPEERAICRHLNVGSLTANDLISRTALPVSVFNITITGLELRGLICEKDGKWRIR